MITHTLSPLRRRGFDLRVASRLLLVTALAAHALPAQAQQVAAYSVPTVQASRGPSSNSLSPINIQYTGRLFGYYRVEPDIDLDDLTNAYDAEVAAKMGNSPAPLPHALLTRPGAFLKQRQLTSPDLLLGMGDNFGPEFGASIQQELSSKKLCQLDAPVWIAGQWDTYAPESLYKSESRKPNLADCDNVTRFLMAAGYRAVVPGREDFLYTGTWLRRVAYLLRGASADTPNDANLRAIVTSPTPHWTFGLVPGSDGNCGNDPCAIASSDHKLHMISANLRVTVVSAKDDKPSADKNKSCPLLFATDLGAPMECGQSDSSISASMDWLTRVDGALKPEIHASIEKQTVNSPIFAGQLIKNEISILQTIVNEAIAQSSPRSKAECDTLVADLTTILNFNPPDTTVAKGSSRGKAPSAVPACPSDLGPLNSDLSNLVSAMKQATGNFSLFAKSPKAPSPFLNESALHSAQRLLLQLIFNEQQNAGFTIATIPGGQRVLIIGVVGKETMQEVAPDFFTVYPDTFDCLSIADQSGQNPACVLKQKLFNAANVPGTAAESNYFRRAESKDHPFQVTVGDPLVATETVLRAVWANEQREKRTIDRTILMAQMPSSEAEEVGSQLRYDLGAAVSSMFENSSLSLRPRVDLVLSEAQEEHISGNQVAEINPLRSTVVLSPPLAYESVSNPEWYPPSIATISASNSGIAHSIQIRNTLGFIGDFSTSSTQGNAAVADRGRVATSMAEAADDGSALNDENSPQSPHVTAATLLEFMLATNLPLAGVAPPRLLDLTGPWGKCTADIWKATATCQNQVLTNYLLHTLQIHYKTSAAMLKRRDFWFGDLGTGYDDYTFCDHWVASPDPKAKAYCELHVALDRVLWRGDYAVRVLVDGTTLTSVLKSSAQATAVETTRLANDLHQEWLSTFGLVSTPPTNLVAAASGPESFSLPGVSGCSVAADPPLGKKTPGPAPTAYCAEGFTVATDAAYWITTSAQLAKDQSTYKDIQTFTKAGASGTHLEVDTEKSPTGPTETFLTTAIAEEIMPILPPSTVKPPPLNWAIKQKTNGVQDDLARIEAKSQKRTLMQLDISKFAAGYSFTAPSLNDTDLGNDLSGVSNTQATTPHSSELDLEAAARTITAPLLGQALVFGIQNDFEFDHKRTGNTTGKPATITYQLNSETAGGFAQIHIPQIFWKDPDPSLSIKGPRYLPRFYWVIAPYQYQRQIVGSPLYFGYLTPPYTKNPSQQLTVTVPVSDGFNWKSGLRFEAGGLRQAWAPDSGSYAEVGPEYVIQSHILNGISMPDLVGLSSPVTTHCANPCLVTADTSITSAVQAYYKDNNQTLNGSSQLVPLTRTVHAGGLYWTAHIQKVLNKAKTYSVSFDTAGDSYLLPGYTLPTQTRYAISNKLAFNMNFLGNLSFSPTYSVFNFENQGVSSERISVNTTSFEVMLKWYYGRDTQSPPFRLLWFTGPKSGDQTASTKLK